MNDISVEDFADILCLLEPVPETVEKKVWYKTQKQHMVVWFQEQTTTGFGKYTRDTANYSARVCYNHLLNARALLWIAYALGESSDVIQAASEAVEKESNFRKQCSAFREVIPFERICALLDKPKSWKLDPALLPFLEYDEVGYPEIRQKPNKDKKVAEAIIYKELYPDY